MEKTEIRRYLGELNELLQQRNLQGEAVIFGGAAMVLLFEARASTRDIDAIFHPARELREMIGTVAARHGLSADWLNDGVKGFVSDKGVQDYRLYEEMSHLRVFAAAPEYLLAMKCISLRLGDSHDENDVRFLLDRLGINEVERAFGIVEKYYQRDRIPPKTQFALQELIARRRPAESGPATGGG